MKPFLPPVALCALAIASPAIAQVAPETGESLAIQRDARSCSVTTARDAPQGMAVSVGLDVDGKAWLRASGKGWPFVEGQSYRIRFRPVFPLDAAPTADPEGEPAYDAAGFHDSGGWGGVEIASWPPVLASSTLALYSGAETKPVAVIVNPVWDRFAELRACLMDLARADAGSGKPAVTRAVLRGSPQNLVTNDDYPPAALRANESGVTGIRLTVSAHGIPSDCEVTLTSGSAVLDGTTCALFTRRAHFTPARDADAQPTRGSFDVRIRWVIPSDRPPGMPLVK